MFDGTLPLFFDRGGVNICKSPAVHTCNSRSVKLCTRYVVCELVSDRGRSSSEAVKSTVISPSLHQP